MLATPHRKARSSRRLPNLGLHLVAHVQGMTWRAVLVEHENVRRDTDPAEQAQHVVLAREVAAMVAPSAHQPPCSPRDLSNRCVVFRPDWINVRVVERQGVSGYQRKQVDHLDRAKAAQLGSSQKTENKAR